ncbi:hypothetical protein H8D29_05650, partial [PVC group bacterium]|nr:hypothetical protein [PVC group bacterium]
MILFQVLIVSLTTLSCLGEPYKNMSIGMEISLPSDGKVVATSSEPPSCMIQGGFGQSSWHMKFDRVLDTQKKSARELVQLALERHKSSGGIKIIDDMAMQCGKIEGWWTRISLPIKDGRDSTICWLVLPIRGNQALMASILTTQEAWQLSGKSLLSSIQSIKPLDPLTTLSVRITGLDNATTLLSDLSAQSLSEVIGISSWRQIQKSQDGQIRPIEIGYAHIESRIGTKNEVGAGKESNQEKGLVVEIHSRIIPDQESQIVTDTSGYYWMSFDGKEEIWSSTSTRWKGKIQTTQKETGIRQRPSLG